MKHEVRSTRTVGVLGGMGPAATADFLRRLVEATNAERDQEHLHVLIDSDPRVPDRTEALLHGGESPAPYLIEIAQRLRSMGADLLVIACNTAHAFLEEVAPRVDVPFVDWIGEVVDHVAADATGVRTVGLLATTGTIRAGLYQGRFEQAGVATVVPDDADQRLLTEAIYGPNGLKAGHTAQPLVAEIARRLVRGGGEALIVACTDLSVMRLDNELRGETRVYDGAQIVAERVVELAGSVVERVRVA